MGRGIAAMLPQLLPFPQPQHTPIPTLVFAPFLPAPMLQGHSIPTMCTDLRVLGLFLELLACSNDCLQWQPGCTE